VSRDAAGQICDEIETALLWPLQTLLGNDDLFREIRERARHAAERLAADLTGGDERIAAQTAIDLANALFPGDTAIPDDWWGTPLGRLMARTAGHPAAEAVSYRVAAAMLGLSKPRVQQFAGDGRLLKHPDGGVTTASVRGLLQDREAS
jgi:hypothetical protein